MTKLEIIGEAAFQTNSDSFAVSPSAEGYTLNYSADGVNYTPWTEATPASETLVVNGTAQGMFFKLAGNASNVTITY